MIPENVVSEYEVKISNERNRVILLEKELNELNVKLNYYVQHEKELTDNMKSMESSINVRIQAECDKLLKDRQVNERNLD